VSARDGLGLRRERGGSRGARGCSSTRGNRSPEWIWIYSFPLMTERAGGSGPSPAARAKARRCGEHVQRRFDGCGGKRRPRPQRQPSPSVLEGPLRAAGGGFGLPVCTLPASREPGSPTEPATLLFPAASAPAFKHRASLVTGGEAKGGGLCVSCRRKAR